MNITNPASHSLKYVLNISLKNYHKNKISFKNTMKKSFKGTNNYVVKQPHFAFIQR